MPEQHLDAKAGNDTVAGNEDQANSPASLPWALSKKLCASIQDPISTSYSVNWFRGFMSSYRKTKNDKAVYFSLHL